MGAILKEIGSKLLEWTNYYDSEEGVVGYPCLHNVCTKSKKRE